MRREDVRVCVIRIEGTNCEDESAEVFKSLGAKPEKVHLKQFISKDVASEERRKLSDYEILFFPGGFSAGDYLRAGAIFAARLKSSMSRDLKEFVRAGKPVLGVCNGFQVMVELGMLPDFEHAVIRAEPNSVLHKNDSDRYECRPTWLKHVNRGTSRLTKRVPFNDVRMIPSAHGEGKLLFALDQLDAMMKKLEDNDQVVWKYVNERGDENVGYPLNPNGAPQNIAGICNPEGNVLGMMPHPERAFWRHQHPDWTRTGLETEKGFDVGDGRALFESVLEYAERRL